MDSFSLVVAVQSLLFAADGSNDLQPFLILRLNSNRVKPYGPCLNESNTLIFTVLAARQTECLCVRIVVLAVDRCLPIVIGSLLQMQCSRKR
jgi:uncharacterized protein (DUF1786 family)